MMAALVRETSAGFCLDEELDMFESDHAAGGKHDSDSEDDDVDVKEHHDASRLNDNMMAGESAQSSTLAAMMEGTSWDTPGTQGEFLPLVGRVSSQAMCMPVNGAGQPPRQYAQSMGACYMHASSVPVDIPFLSGNHDALGFTARLEEIDEFIPPHQLSQRHPLMFSLRGESPTLSLKRERLKARDAILKLTGFVERGASKVNLRAMATGGAGVATAATSQRTAVPRSSYEPLGGLSQALSFSRPSVR